MQRFEGSPVKSCVCLKYIIVLLVRFTPHKLIAKQTLFHNVGTAVADMDGVVTAISLPLVGGFIP